MKYEASKVKEDKAESVTQESKFLRHCLIKFKSFMSIIKSEHGLHQSKEIFPLSQAEITNKSSRLHFFVPVLN